MTTLAFWANKDVDDEEDDDDDDDDDEHSDPVDDLLCSGSASPISVILTGLEALPCGVGVVGVVSQPMEERRVASGNAAASC